MACTPLSNGATTEALAMALPLVFYNADLHNPGPAMFSVVMLGWTRRCEAFSLADCVAWFADAGLGAPEMHASEGIPSNWLVASRK
jgi:hypothetical protein